MFEKLSEFLDGELDKVTCDEIQRHVRDCIPCEVCFKTLKRTVELCRESETMAVPDTVARRLREAVGAMLRGERQ
jgi:hypothetical protein